MRKTKLDALSFETTTTCQEEDKKPPTAIEIICDFS